MSSIKTKQTYQEPTAEICKLDLTDIVRTSNAAEIDYNTWADGNVFDAPCGEN